ncbi:MAG: EamA family transporter [Acidimicrobiales bacterium]|nr:EamA family transporter [Acidimicrobiales bacterium]
MVWALGIYFSIAIGVGDFFGAFLARRSHSYSTVLSYLLIGGTSAVPLLFLIDSEFIGRDVGFGILGGLTVGFALTLLYHGMTVSSAAVVSPVTAVVTALIPVAWDVVTGAELAALVVVGIVVSLAGLGVTTFSPELGDRARQGVAWGLASGTCFGVSLTFIGQASIESGMWATVFQRYTAFLVLAVLATAQGIPRFVPRALLPQALLGGVLTGTGVGAFVAGAQRGSLSEITVTASMFPAVTVVLASVFEKHPLRWWQGIGLVTVVTGVVLIGVG